MLEILKTRTVLSVCLSFTAVAMPLVSIADDPTQSQPIATTVYEEAEDEAEKHASSSAAEIAAELANPNTALGSLNFNFDYIHYGGDLPGAGDQNAVRMTFQPVLPYPVGNGVNFFLRPAIPVIFKQDVPSGNGYDNPGLNLGDTNFDAALVAGWHVHES